MTKDEHGFLEQVVFSRKSVRNYTGEQVSNEALTVLLKAAMAAPSGRNEQPWEYVAITTMATLQLLSEQLPYAKMVVKAGTAILVCGHPITPSRPGGKELWEQDCAAATENILLSAEALGLGAVWTAVHPYPERQDIVRRILGIPDTIMPFSLIPVGYPAGGESPKNKYDPAKIHWERWSF